MAERLANFKKKKLPDEPPFVEIDVHGFDIRQASDEGRREYPIETQSFKNKMYFADLEVENLLINDINLVESVSEALHRMGKRVGRKKVRSEIKEIRLQGWEGKDKLLDELIRDIQQANSLSQKDTTAPSKGSFKKGFELMLKAESLYFNSVLDLPWNKVGPEPFDILIDVFWFRFRFGGLKFDWQGRDQLRESLQKDIYKRAQIDRILTWAYKTQDGVIANNLKDLKELGITYNMAEVEEVAGPLFLFVDKTRLREAFEDPLKRSRPSGLTLLLWKTLKWASASEWRAHNAIHFSDLPFMDRDLWDEKIPDPSWQEISDSQGRLKLVGEKFKNPLSHIKSDKSNKHSQMENTLAFEMESQSGDITLADVVREKQRQLRQKNPKSFESVTKDFAEVISSMNLDGLMKQINKLSDNQRVIVLHRLGYDLSAEQSRIKDRFGGVTVESSRPVMYLINILFKGYQNRYYNELRTITKLLESR